MSHDTRSVGIFTLAQAFPCGPGSSCCGPIGQPEEEIGAIKAAIEQLGVQVHVHDVSDQRLAQSYPTVFRLLASFGPGAVPILTVGDEVVCMGRSDVEEIVKTVEEKIIAV